MSLYSHYRVKLNVLFKIENPFCKANVFLICIHQICHKLYIGRVTNGLGYDRQNGLSVMGKKRDKYIKTCKGLSDHKPYAKLLNILSSLFINFVLKIRYLNYT